MDRAFGLWSITETHYGNIMMDDRVMWGWIIVCGTGCLLLQKSWIVFKVTEADGGSIPLNTTMMVFCYKSMLPSYLRELVPHEISSMVKLKSPQIFLARKIIWKTNTTVSVSPLWVLWGGTRFSHVQPHTWETSLPSMLMDSLTSSWILSSKMGPPRKECNCKDISSASHHYPSLVRVSHIGPC